MRKKLSVLLCLCMLCASTFGACNKENEPSGNTPGGDESGDNAGQTPGGDDGSVETVEKDEFLLGSWVAYYNPTEGGLSMSQQTKQLADAGLNFVMYGSWIHDAGEPVERDLASLDWWKHVDSVMVENGMKYMFAAQCDGANNSHSVKGTLNNMSDEAVASAASIVPQLENCLGYMVKDEPQGSQIPAVAEYAKKYAQIQEGRYPFVNMNPSTVGEVYGWNILCGSYENYFETFIKSTGAENLEFISHDHYPFGKSSTDLSIYNDMEVMRKVGLKYDLKTHGFPQACAWGGQRMPNADEIRWNVYAYLAYGFKAVSYFNYVMWQGESCYAGLIDLEGNIADRELYDAVAAMNWDIRRTSDIIMNLDCLHAYHVLDNIAGETVELLPNNALVNPPADADLIVSYMMARDGTEPYVMIYNKSFEDEIVDLPFTLGTNSGITGLEVFNPTTEEHEALTVENNGFKLSLKAGEGKYIRLLGDVNMK